MLEIQEQVPLNVFTSYKIGGPARYFCEPGSAAEVKSALDFAAGAGLQIYILGKGTNLLISDQGIDGLVIRIGQRLGSWSLEGGAVRVGAGLMLDRLIGFLAEEGYGGFEKLAGIPGSVGGSLFMNAGAHGVALGNFVLESLVMNHHGELRRLSPKEHDFAYRSSVFQQQAMIVLETRLGITVHPRDQLRETIVQTKELRKRLPPLPSCGSTFKNPEGMYAGQIIEELGLKGTQIGKAQISPIHANFIVNLGGASAQDVHSLIELVQKEAAARRIVLETEVRFWGRF